MEVPHKSNPSRSADPDLGNAGGRVRPAWPSGRSQALEVTDLPGGMGLKILPDFTGL